MIAALAVTLGLFGLAVWALRRYGPGLVARMQASQGERRLRIVETLVIDPQRRVVLFSLDGRERLLLLGEGRLLSTEDAK